MVRQVQRNSRLWRWTVLIICASALFLVGLDTTIVAVGLPQMSAALRLDAHTVPWVIDAYTVTFASLLITAGALADRFGRRRVFSTGLVVFALASLLCALAPSFPVLLVGRVLQGVGASMLTPVALSIVVNVMTEPRERAQAIGVWGAVFGLSMAIGPVLGGLLLVHFDWRALFWINVPLVAVALVLVCFFVPESRAELRRVLDVPGQLLLTVALALAVSLVIHGTGSWPGVTVLVVVVALVTCVVGFWRLERSQRFPLIDPGLLRRPALVGALLSAVVVFVGFSTALLVPTYFLQEQLGWSPLVAGGATMPMAVGVLLCAPFSGYLVGRLGPTVPLVLGGAALLAGGVLLLVFARSLHLGLLLTAYWFVGAGIGLANAPITNTAVNSLPPNRAGVAGGLTSTARQMGLAFGAALTAGSTTLPLVGIPIFSVWSVTACCGGLVLVVAAMSRSGVWRTAKESKEK